MISFFEIGRFSGRGAQHLQPGCSYGPCPALCCSPGRAPTGGGVEGWKDRVQKILCRAGRGRIGGSKLRGGRGGCSISARRGGGRDHCTVDPHLWLKPCYPILRSVSANDPSPSTAASAPSGCARPFPPDDRRRDGGSSAPSAPPALAPASRAAPELFPLSSRPPAAGTRVAAYKRGGARASPPLPAAERTARR